MFNKMFQKHPSTPTPQLTNREIIQHVLNEPVNILYPCIETGTLERDNIEEEMRLLNLRSLGFHTSFVILHPIHRYFFCTTIVC